MLLASPRRVIFVVLSCVWTLSFADLLDSREALQQARMAAKPWYAQNIADSIPVSPVTVAVTFLTIFYVIYFWNGKPTYVVASHILVKDSSDESKEKLEGWKKKIGVDKALFEKYAAQYSDCPSKQNGGKLGRFGKGAMVPQFDRICFDPKSPLKTPLGPIKTQFGWHLIYIDDRKLPE